MGRAVAHARKDQQRTQVQLCDYMHWADRSSAIRLEKGEASITSPQVKLIAMFLDLTAEELTAEAERLFRGRRRPRRSP
jgi:hypothetical protein